MRFRTYRPRSLLLAAIPALSLPLLSTGCVTASTKASRARTERPEMPQRPSELGQTERLQTLRARPVSGDDVVISHTVLEELYDRLADAVGAVEKLNIRIAGNTRLWVCTDAIFKAGKAPAGCPSPK